MPATNAPQPESRPSPIRHDGSCGIERRQCWRRACRDAWLTSNTVETLRNGVVLAHCHGGSYSSATDFDLRVEFWKYGDVTVTS